MAAATSLLIGIGRIYNLKGKTKNFILFTVMKMKYRAAEEHKKIVFSNTSLRLMLLILTVAFVLYFCALACISCAEDIFPDADTACYWFEQFALSGKEVLGSLTAVFFFELFSLCAGERQK